MPVILVGNSQAYTDLADYCTMSKPAGTQEGDLIVTAVAQGSVSTDPVTQPSGFNKYITGIATGVFAYKFASASEPSTYTWQWGSNLRAAGGLGVFRGIDRFRSHPFAQNYENSYQASPTTSAYGTIDTQGKQSLLLAFSTAWGQVSNITSIGVPSGYTEFAAVNSLGNPGISMCYKLNNANEIPGGTTITATSPGNGIRWNTIFGSFIVRVPNQGVL